MRPKRPPALNARAGTTNVNSRRRRTVVCPPSSMSFLIFILLVFNWACRQVSDLQVRIEELEQENTRLRVALGDVMEMQLDSAASARNSLKRAQAALLPNFDHVRNNIRLHAEGIFQPPARGERGSPVDPVGLPPVPPRMSYAHMSHSYHDSIHETYPVLHWPQFQSDADRIYMEKGFSGMSKESVGLFFAVLACGCLNLGPASGGSPDPDSEGPRCYELACQAVTPWPTKCSIVHVQLFLLLSIYAAETNMKCGGSLWLACAIRTAQDLGLHLEDGSESYPEAEMRRRLWWAIYTRDRLVISPRRATHC